VPQITALKTQKNTQRVNVFLDNKFAFGIDLASLLKLNLQKGTILTEKEIASIVKKANYQRHTYLAIKYASLRPRSQFELTTWIKRKKIHPTLHKKILAKLKKLNLLSDEKFANWWVTQRLEFSTKSKKELKYELIKKGINQSLISKVLSEKKIDEEEILKKLIAKKPSRFKNLTSAIQKQKAMKYLAQKGFSWEVVKKLLN
jgi:regulatory protein